MSLIDRELPLDTPDLVVIQEQKLYVGQPHNSLRKIGDLVVIQIESFKVD